MLLIMLKFTSHNDLHISIKLISIRKTRKSRTFGCGEPFRHLINNLQVDF